MRCDNIRKSDPAVAGAVESEINRQRKTLNLIASENIAGRAVTEATGSVLTNKYAEGLPGARYYGGNEFIDVCESLAIERAKKIFCAEHANVQPHSGCQANMITFFALSDWLKRGKRLMGMSLSCGGHLSHGSVASFAGKLFEASNYTVDRETFLIDYDDVRRKALEFRPTILVSGASAYPRAIDFKAFGEIAEECGAYHVSDVAHIAGLIAAGAHQNPTPYADAVTTTTHKTLRGPRGAMIMCRAEHSEAIDKACFPGVQGGPIENAIAAKAVALKEAMSPEFAEYQRQTIRNAKTLAETLTENGLNIITGGTDNHLMLADVTPLGITGGEAEKMLESAGIIANKNAIPFDPRKPSDPSGIRLGTPALTSRGMKESEMKEIGLIIAGLLRKKTYAIRAKARVYELCGQFDIHDGQNI